MPPFYIFNFRASSRKFCKHFTESHNLLEFIVPSFLLVNIFYQVDEGQKTGFYGDSVKDSTEKALITNISHQL